jgi:hypothetical protein
MPPNLLQLRAALSPSTGFVRRCEQARFAPCGGTRKHDLGRVDVALGDRALLRVPAWCWT